MTSLTCSEAIYRNGIEYLCAEDIVLLKLVAATVFTLIMIVTVIGNVMVILVILRDKKFQTPSNYLILSLAVTDLLVGAVAVPSQAVIELKDYGDWPYGAFLCDLHVAIDRVCIYTSILHLLSIAVDRYRSVTSVQYSLTRNNGRALKMIAATWTVSVCLAIAPPLGWRDNKFYERIANRICLVSKDVSGNVIVWFLIVVVPVTTMALLYSRIYQIAKLSLERKQPGVKDFSSFSQSSGNSSTKDKRSERTLDREVSLTDEDQRQPGVAEEEQREKRVAKTLVVITSCVLICWLPFFVVFILTTLFPHVFATSSGLPFKITVWLGFLNSLINPFIYAVMNPHYREGFNKLLFIERN